jgi:hypothetical protein
MSASTPVSSAATSHLHGELLFRGEPEVAFVQNLGVVVDEADDAERNQREQRDPDVDVGADRPTAAWDRRC